MDSTRSASFLRSFDWVTFILYLLLVVAGWFTISAASYNLDGVSVLDFATPSGKQLVWLGLSLVLIAVILALDTRFYMTYAPVIYTLIMLVLLVTIFIAPDIKGSHSWLKIGTFSIQPAEFGKFSTALMLAWLFNNYNFRLTKPAGFLRACLVILLPVVLIILQRETGSALVYFSLILLFYRQGMSGTVLWAVFCAVVIFVVGIRYSVDLTTGEPSLLGQELVLTFIPLMVALMLAAYVKQPVQALILVGVSAVGFLAAWIVQRFVLAPSAPAVLLADGAVADSLASVLPAGADGAALLPEAPEAVPAADGLAAAAAVAADDVSPLRAAAAVHLYQWAGWFLSAFAVLYCVWHFLLRKVGRYLLVAGFGLAFVAFLYTADFAFSKLQPHQRVRIEVLLGMKEDLRGAGYNVNQAKIAIGSGGLTGKGYLEGTQTKLGYVPEQETDFIFCTVGEEQGFVGTLVVILLYAALILRLLYLAERQRTVFAHVYGYCVASIFAFHVFINIGMVIGLVPVIGIPLPFFSYGGSGLWSFTILLFIFLRLDASRVEKF